jgi:hypothetical protein
MRVQKTKSMTFEEALKENNLGSMLEEQFGAWGHFTEEAARVIITAASKETDPSSRTLLASMLALTMAEESCFNLYQGPNVNGKPDCPASWDFGPCQINFWWQVLEAWEGRIITKGLPWRSVFGAPPYDPTGSFTGDPVFNTRACARILLSKLPKNGQLEAGKSLSETRVIYYTGGDELRRMHRSEDWKKYGPLFQTFFEKFST